MCVLTPQSIEGPFYVDPKLVRIDITEGRDGIPLRLRLRVIHAGPCTPVADARIDIWHCDARGLYSGYPGQGDDRSIDTSGQTFLRGTQTTDSEGCATFDTIYPGLIGPHGVVQG
ncbi:Dioxygenase [Methylobacterium pseudosasicola]|uniref:Dioxygenase n=2 Tax=Methylobacterium pseudosasicola TaxID=582667 RepID=A0A1I4T6E1_9HYPH|nr:Dioxygenase [Methylobacterium pseudosasicola]